MSASDVGHSPIVSGLAAAHVGVCVKHGTADARLVSLLGSTLACAPDRGFP